MDELIKSHFRKEIHFAGILRLDDIDVAKATADIKFNPFDTQNIEVRLTDFERIDNRSEVLNLIDRNKKLLLRSVDSVEKMEVKLNETYNRSLEIPFSNITLWTSAEEIKETKLYDIHQKNENPKINNIQWEYYFPIIDFTKYSYGKGTRHNHRGLYRGWNRRDAEGKWTDDIDWDDDIISFSCRSFEVKIADCFYFGELNDDNKSFPTDIIVRHSLMNINSSLSDTSLQDRAALNKIEEEKDEFVKVIFHFLSIFEHKMVKWYHEKKTLSYDDSHQEVIRYKWIPEIRTSMWPSPSSQYKKELRELLPVLVNNYYLLSPNLKRDFYHVARCFEFACYAPSLEVSFIYWHSCLDLLKKIFQHRGKPFSRKLIEACEDNNVKVQYSDLFPTPTREEIMRGTKFRFTEIRNQYLHDGFVIDNYDELVDLRSKICGLVERMILRLLNIDYRDTPLGKGKYFTRYV